MDDQTNEKTAATPEPEGTDEATGKARGGIARAEALSPEQRSEIASKAAQARWDNSLPRATHDGVIKLGGVEIACAVLTDGRRVITQSDFMRALGRARQAKGRQHYKGDVNLPVFLTAQNLKPHVSKELEVTSSQIEFRPLRGARAFGYAAELLPAVCDVFLDADEAGDLLPAQEHILKQAKLIMRGLARVGIAALIDEATGYQDVRDRQALQAILDAFLRKEFAAWAKRFPDDFYKEMFRLKGWALNPLKVKRPGVVGTYTNNIVYERLAPGILEELKRRNPKNERGNRTSKHHQFLTDDVGHPALAQHLYAVIGAMRASENWQSFMSFLDKAYPKRNATLPLGLPEPEKT